MLTVLAFLALIVICILMIISDIGFALIAGVFALIADIINGRRK